MCEHCNEIIKRASLSREKLSYFIMMYCTIFCKIAEVSRSTTMCVRYITEYIICTATFIMVENAYI
jgi:hypothetical protein